MTHCRSEKLECRSFAMSGSATFTTVMSSSSMNVATQTAPSVHQRFGCFSSGSAVHGDLGAAGHARVVGAEVAMTPRDLRRLDPGVVVGVGHRGAVGGRVDHGGQDGVDADAVAAVLGVEGADEGQQGGLGGMYPAAPGNGRNAARAQRRRSRRRPPASAGSPPRSRGTSAAGSAGTGRSNSSTGVSCTRPPWAKPPTRLTTAQAGARPARRPGRPAWSNRSASTKRGARARRARELPLVDHGTTTPSPRAQASAHRPAEAAGRSRDQRGSCHVSFIFARDS